MIQMSKWNGFEACNWLAWRSTGRILESPFELYVDLRLHRVNGPQPFIWWYQKQWCCMIVLGPPKGNYVVSQILAPRWGDSFPQMTTSRPVGWDEVSMGMIMPCHGCWLLKIADVQWKKCQALCDRTTIKKRPHYKCSSHCNIKVANRLNSILT